MVARPRAARRTRSSPERLQAHIRAHIFSRQRFLLTYRVPVGVVFATQAGRWPPRCSLTHSTAGLPRPGIAGDEVYGADPDLRAALETRGTGHVLVITSNRRLPTRSAPTFSPPRCGVGAWQRFSAGSGANGQRTTTGPASTCPTLTAVWARPTGAAHPPLAAHRGAGLLPLLRPRPAAGKRLPATAEGVAGAPGRPEEPHLAPQAEAAARSTKA